MVPLRLFLGIFCLTVVIAAPNPNETFVSSTRQITSQSANEAPVVSRSWLPLNIPRSAEDLIDSIIGSYENLDYEEHERTDYDYTTVTKSNATTLRWENREGIWWYYALRPLGDGYDPRSFTVFSDCPYYPDYYTEALIWWKFNNNAVDAILGPDEEPFYRVYTADEVVNSLLGTYRWARNPSSTNDWHHATVTRQGETTLRWNYRNGRSYTLELIPWNSGFDPDYLTVGRDSPFYRRGYTEAKVMRNDDSFAVTGIMAPGDVLFARVHSASEVMSGLVGNYDSLKYSGSQKSPWHFVTLSRVDGTTLRWRNHAGASWSIKLKPKAGGYDPDCFDVESDSPFYHDGHTWGEATWNYLHTSVIAVSGPVPR